MNLAHVLFLLVFGIAVSSSSHEPSRQESWPLPLLTESCLLVNSEVRLLSEHKS